MEKFTPISLSNYCNASLSEPYPESGGTPNWDDGTINALGQLTLEEVSARGIPFLLGSQLIVLPAPAEGEEAGEPITVPIGKQAHYACIAHCCAMRPGDGMDPSIGDEVARYVLVYSDGSQHSVAMRRRFEICPLRNPLGRAFVATTMGSSRPLRGDEQGGWGWRQTGVGGDGLPGIWIYALPNPAPEKKLDNIRLECLSQDGVAIFGITLAHFPDHPLRHWPRNTFRISLPEGKEVLMSAVSVDLDMGHITRMYPDPSFDEEKWLEDQQAGLGTEAQREAQPIRDLMVEATGSKAASFQIQLEDEKLELSYGEALKSGEASHPSGARVELCHPHKTWVHVKIADEEAGQLVATRARFLGPRGEYLPPYGHPADVNTNWFEDEGGNIVLGGDTFAYVPGEFQMDLPVGDVFVELNKGFEYQPVRKKLKIEPGTREITLKIKRFTNLQERGFMTADTHVHFLSPQTAWLEGQCEGLNLVNLLASQWGRLFTNVADITGKVSGCTDKDTIVFVGTENRHHMLGHMSMLGTQGMPVFPMCTGGPGEAWFGDADVRSQVDWVDEVRSKGGVAIRPHFPGPNCEIAADIILGKVDALEVRQFGLFNDSLDTSSIREWYRYLNCGYRVPAVGGTDKMSAGMPVGGVRTYAQLGSDDEFSFDNWGKAVRAGRTFTSSGPLIGMTADGREVGEEIRMPSGGGTLEIDAWAVCAQPIHGLGIVYNGQVVASQKSESDTNRLELKEKIKVDGSGWLAARCFSRYRVWHVWPVNVAAHTSPIYVVADGQEVYNPSDAVYIMTLVHGGLEWVDTLSIKADEESHQRLRSVFTSAESKHRKKMEGHTHHH